MKRGRPQLLVCLFVALACVIGSSSALAKVKHHGGYTYVSKGLELGRKAFARHTLDCPKGTHAYGGGISGKAAFEKLYQTQSYPVDTKDANKDPDDGWGVLVDNSGKKLQARMYAICGKKNPTYTKTHEDLGPQQLTQEVESHCASSVLGGGVRGSKGVEFEDGGPLNSTTWYSYSRNDSTKSGSFNQYAICAQLPMTYLETGGQTTPMSQISYRASCPSGYSAISGGSSTTGAVRTTTSVPFGTYKGWLFRGDFFGNFQGTSNALAACAANQN